MKCRYSAKLKGKIFKTEETRGYIWGGVYSRNIFQRVRFPVGYWYEDMINGFLIRPQTKKLSLVPNVLCFKNKHSGNLSNIVELSTDYHCLDQIYLAKSLIQDYYKLGFHDEDYIFRCALNEFSNLGVSRTQRLDIDTRKQILLACHEIMSSFKHVPSGLSAKQQIFYDAIMSKDFTAWNMAAKL